MFKRCFNFLLVLLLFLSTTFVQSYAADAKPVSQFIIINKTINRLAFYENGKLVREFKVATGRSEDLTPEGKFKIVNKIVNRPYYKDHIPGGDPKNPLGNRWLGLNARGTWGTTYAIHGNNNPSSIGTYASSGCVRMYDEEVEWLFDRVNKNTTVLITSSTKSFQDIAIANHLFDDESDSVVVTKPTDIPTSLKLGSVGSEVEWLQDTLTKLGYSTNGVDGYFAKGTDQAVRAFQLVNGLEVDGVVGAGTKKLLIEKLRDKKRELVSAYFYTFTLKKNIKINGAVRTDSHLNGVQKLNY
ncbi:L,D-transpeptidase family protein [Bacillus sp. AFS055030]|uniref:L,D-transpeptidase family protein n=1 Tax=Bacillus sp. AFS055030 TaxID=2033507 RepID=UPI002571073C|nr:L,D-transpeptidase family protein [Bacillus sp. AFS055030]